MNANQNDLGGRTSLWAGDEAQGEAVSPRAGGPWAAAAVGWLSGLVLLAGLVIVTLHVTELERFAVLVRRAQPVWLLVGVGLQAGTYVCAALTLRRSLAQFGVRQPLAALVPLGLAKLFTDQAVPSVGLSGTLLMVRSLARRGIPRGVSVAAMLTGLVSYYIATAWSWPCHSRCSGGMEN